MADEWTKLKDAATLIETKIGHEVNLVGQRMTWLVLSESFLFAAWINIANGGIAEPERSLLHNVVWTIGFSSAVLAAIATRAALLVGDALLVARQHVEDRLRRLVPYKGDELFPPLGTRREGVTKRTHVTGAVTAAFLPPLFVSAWVAIAIQNGNIVKDPVLAVLSAVGPAVFVGGGLLFERRLRRGAD